MFCFFVLPGILWNKAKCVASKRFDECAIRSYPMNHLICSDSIVWFDNICVNKTGEFFSLGPVLVCNLSSIFQCLCRVVSYLVVGFSYTILLRG